jgi:hypothetical protein
MISKRRASTDRQRRAIDLSAKALVPAAQLLISGSRPIDAPGRVFFLNHRAPAQKFEPRVGQFTIATGARARRSA